MDNSNISDTLPTSAPESESKVRGATIEQISLPYNEHARQAINIYVRTTAPTIQTHADDFEYRLRHPSSSFNFYLFALKYDDEVIGMAMISIVGEVLIYEYITLSEEKKDKYSLYFTYFELIDDFVNHLENTKIIYRVSEIIKNENENNDETFLFKHLLGIQGFKVIPISYKALPLINRANESYEVFLYAKIAGNPEQIRASVFLQIVKNIYTDYYRAWYADMVVPTLVSAYDGTITQYRQELEGKLGNTINIPIIKPKFKELTGETPEPHAQEQKQKYNISKKNYLYLLICFVVCPVAVVYILQLFEACNVNIACAVTLFNNIVFIFISRLYSKGSGNSAADVKHIAPVLSHEGK